MYKDGIKLLVSGIEQYVGQMTVNEFDLVNEAENQLRSNTLNKDDLRKLVEKAQRIIFKYSKDALDLDVIVGY